MIIDFHTHMFPHIIAERTIRQLASNIHQRPYLDGTYEQLLDSTEKAGIDLAVALPIATKPSHFRTINEFAARHQEGRILSFGTIHPDSAADPADYKDKLRKIRDMGLKGIKLHPDYQQTYFNDIRYKRILAYASELGLIVSVHAGVDPKWPDDVHCTPQMAEEVLREVAPERLILAHMGGFLMWDEVEEHLVGRDVWFDTAVVFDYMKEEQFLRILRNHGSDRVLFATDSPWADQKKFVEVLKNMPVTEEERERIFAGNAERMLGKVLLSGRNLKCF